jgi:hypothetical protein
MATTYPYISGPGNITQLIVQLRKAFPATVTAETVKKLGLAPNNESYLINTLQFIGLLDSDGKKTSAAGQVFSKHKDDDFAKAFGDLVKKAYAALFELHADGTWALSNEELITFFRESDQTSEVIGRRQASAFKVLAALAGHGEAPATKSAKSKSASAAPKTKAKQKIGAKAGKDEASSASVTESPAASGAHAKGIGLSVRIEINLPADGTKETYDNIFKSLRENLLNG